MMRYKYKVIDITENKNNDKIEAMESMSLKKLQKKLDHKKLYKIVFCYLYVFLNVICHISFLRCIPLLQLVSTKNTLTIQMPFKRYKLLYLLGLTFIFLSTK